ncbi:MAG: tRNA (N6-threonylcarbamoyladenosine(37)-N6)-methyltransferase TrmO [Methanothrix harundinacea]|nr:tRNA (N6-threonylcarbamoyladenosine(37)-N6)-methyltransferase TrmO [Methanothrix harundinacea]
MDLKQMGIIQSAFKTRAEAPSRVGIQRGSSRWRSSRSSCLGSRTSRGAPPTPLYWLDRANRKMLKALPHDDGRGHCVFATRSPNWPTPIGIGTVELSGISSGRLRARGSMRWRRRRCWASSPISRRSTAPLKPP